MLVIVGIYKSCCNLKLLLISYIYTWINLNTETNYDSCFWKSVNKTKVDLASNKLNVTKFLNPSKSQAVRNESIVPFKYYFEYCKRHAHRTKLTISKIIDIYIIISSIYFFVLISHRYFWSLLSPLALPRT